MSNTANSNEEAERDAITTLDSHMPAPPKDGTATTQDSHVSTPPQDDAITTLDSHMPAPPALDLDGK
ncbi:MULTISPECIES: sigma-like protein [unclassified Streptomyces]|uniref:sigma-like protein n=1 Tax=unclassified Streptomyces TaxID=2593676 RepID=UPI000939AA94|nr:sigma-like protein [Streptomyces sp. CB02400]OKK07378.1 sigma-like protein [Streptomyces sp. CB02400]